MILAEGRTLEAADLGLDAVAHGPVAGTTGAC